MGSQALKLKQAEEKVKVWGRNRSAGKPKSHQKKGGGEGSLTLEDVCMYIIPR